ncbi:MAG: dockerin type I domain-containing protein, partial [Oscillospiraceae bacterium]|nr:dockerin type I domain-containing protein [Oscillospiraceae bacterium]
GYDNNFEITVNNVTLKGAFKLANSWGETWDEGNNGFIWVMYDALNSNNKHGSQWNNNFSYPRASVFGYCNPFYFIDVAKCDVYFAGLVHFMTNNPNGFRIQSSTGLSNYYDTKRLVESYQNLENAEGKYIAFDYFNTDDVYDLSDYMSQSWTVNFTRNVNHNTYRINPRIVDNYCNPIAPLDTIYGSLSSGQYTKTTNIDIVKGRVSAYDNNEITSSDVQLVMRYLNGSVSFSNLQKFLADYNNDGTISILDVIMMNNHLSSLNRECYTLTEYIPEIGCSLAEMMQKENEVKSTY